MIRGDQLVGGEEITDREAQRRLVAARRERQGEGELAGQVGVHIEELRASGHDAEVGVEVGDVETPEHRAFELAAAFAPDLVEIGVVPEIVRGAGEAAVAVEQRRGHGDRPPPVVAQLGVEHEVDPDVVAPVAGGCVAGPRAGNHERRRRADADTQGLVDTDVGAVRLTEPVAADDHQTRVRRVPEVGDEAAHDGHASGEPPGRDRLVKSPPGRDPRIEA